MHVKYRRQEPVTRVVIGFEGPYITGPTNWYLVGLERLKEPHLQISLANLSLSRDPQCIEAHAVLAKYSDSSEERLAHLTAAVKAGDEIWTPVAERYGDRMKWFGFVAIRPYLDAIMELGDTHAELGNDQAARWCYSRLLRMEPRQADDIRRIAGCLEAVSPARVAAR